MNKVRGSAKWGCALFLLFGVFTLPSWAQQDSSSAAKPQDASPKAAGTSVPWALPTTADADSDAPAAAPAGPPNPYVGQIKNAGTGLPLLGTSTTPLRWGDFSVSSFQFVQLYDSFTPSGKAGSPFAALSIFQTGLMFDHYIRKSRIVLQYLPQMAIFQGQIHANAGANNTFGLGTTFVLTPRMSLTVEDNFSQVHSNELIPEKYLATDAFAGALVQNNFLDTNGSFLADTAAATLQYNFSERTILTVTPSFRYAKATSNQVNYAANGKTYHGVVTLGHALTPHRTIGIMESYDIEDTTTGTVPAIAKFYTSSVFYSEQLARSFWVTGNFGGSHQSYSDLRGASGWGLSAQASLIKDFSRIAGLSLIYTRGVAYNNYITSQRSDRVDVSLGLHITPRIALNNTAGYYRELGAGPRTDGKYGMTGFEYQFFGNFSLFSNYAYGFQSSNTPQLLSGVRKTITFGLRWQPPLLPAK
jgi:hypothetical protein